jgi:hypothetical protein
MAARRKRSGCEKGVKACATTCGTKAGTFLAVKRDTLEKIPVATIGSWIPLTAGVPTQAMAAAWPRCWPRPPGRRRCPCRPWTATDPRWKSDAFWRGDVWPPTNYQIASGLAAYGHHGTGRRHRRQDHRQRHQERHQRALRFGHRQGRWASPITA